MKSPPKMPQRAMVRIWVASLHQELQRCYDVGVSVLFGVYNALQGWMRTASTRRTVRRGKKPLWGFFRCAARVIHPRPPRLQRCYDAGVSVLSGLYNALQGWMRTASTRRTVRRGKKPLRGFFRCAACDIHPRPPKKFNV